jgi:hypothetical protein
VVKIEVPPLRERREDVPLLVDPFVARLNRIQGRAVRGVHPEVLGLLMAHDFPGNVRELENVLEHAFVLCDGDRLELRHLPPRLLSGRGRVTPSPAIREAARAAEAALIREALERQGFDRLATARALGIHKSTLFRKIRALGWPFPSGTAAPAATLAEPLDRRRRSEQDDPHRGHAFHSSVSVCKKATMSSSSWLVRRRFPSSSLLTFWATSGAGQRATSRVL